MKTEERVAVSVVFEPELLAEIDRVAKANDMNRSQYLRFCARKELQKFVPTLPAVANSQTQEVPA